MNLQEYKGKTREEKTRQGDVSDVLWFSLEL